MNGHKDGWIDEKSNIKVDAKKEMMQKKIKKKKNDQK